MTKIVELKYIEANIWIDHLKTLYSEDQIIQREPEKEI